MFSDHFPIFSKSWNFYFEFLIVENLENLIHFEKNRDFENSIFDPFFDSTDRFGNLENGDLTGCGKADLLQNMWTETLDFQMQYEDSFENENVQFVVSICDEENQINKEMAFFLMGSEEVKNKSKKKINKKKWKFLKKEWKI